MSTMTIANIREAYKGYRSSTLDSAKRAVEAGGGVWVGIQECEGLKYDAVLFNSPETGSTLALKTTEITADKVRERIAASNALFRKAASAR